MVLLAGKGHEKVQIVKEREIPFEDAQVARDVLTRQALEGCR